MTFLSLMNNVNVPSISNRQKYLEKKLLFVGILKVTDEKSRIPDPDPEVTGTDPDLYQNVTDPQHWKTIHKKVAISV